MADGASKSGSLLSWIGGIAATVIAGVILYYATRPSPPPAPIILPQVGVNGFVADIVSRKPIPDALVTVDLGPKLASQSTDSEGRYAFIMDSTTPAAQTINIDVLAGGYVHYTGTLPIAATGITFAELQVEPIPSAPAQPAAQPPAQPPDQPHPSQGAAPVLHPGAAVPQPSSPAQYPAPPTSTRRAALVLQAPLHYVMRPDATTLRSKPN